MNMDLKHKSKKGDMNFEVIFAILIGGLILFFAIYGALNFGKTVQYETQTEIAKKIAVLTNPMQAGFSEGKTGKIMFNSEIRMFFSCLPDSEDFGENRISTAVPSNAKGEWELPGGEISIYNKYIFSGEMEEGKNFYIFSKAFEFPYKIADMIFLTTENYCFVDSPYKISKEITDLRIENIQLADEITNCSEDSIRVCFGGKCDIQVTGSGGQGDPFSQGYVEKKGKRVFYAGNLIYAAIFSDPDIYYCNVQRLLYRGSKIAEIYALKGDLMNARGCSTNLIPDMTAFSSVLKNTKPENIIAIVPVAEDLRTKAEREECGIW